MASVEFEQVDKTYPNGHRAISDLSLRIEDGELMVFVGPSGCGKSTLLRILAGLEEISAGTIKIGDRVANELSPQQRNIAMVFQDYALYPTMTVRGNLEFPLKMRKLGKEEIRRRVGWAADMLGLGEVMDRLPKQLSGGQRQRVAMGRALVREPTVFLLDEPLSNLDAKLRTQVRAEIGDLQRRTGATMIYVTHDQVEAMTLGQRIAVLDQGRIQQVASPKELYEHPANTFVAGFIGNPPMNLFTAELRKDLDGRLQLMVNGQALPVSPDKHAANLRDGGLSVTAGFRPEAVRLSEDGGAGFPATLVNAEYLGHETLLHFRPGRSGDQPVEAPVWTARLPGLHIFSKGDAVRLTVSPDQIYLFD
ncbi:ABC transporter ATP-binding protein [Methylocaldum sp.]|uniref:ABC transporter ATP-binding protein n=1 Tax=Methylocaldum sp. TaxID=1969727 RepID=UPI002D38C813|nr:ATP-binding cassette domain-containing protein [Methylocaldum sp.]HYE37990.1 ATP-binding cassette domain-containing protein [Methylocaldum sp.]